MRKLKKNMNCVFMEYKAFPLHKHLIKPFHQRLLNKEHKFFLLPFVKGAMHGRKYIWYYGK